ncbi:O-methyltransferase [Fodinicurvata halophila]|uniref:O-methyltransferase n=1 Tax=Fodinicurvata halophila TaxID=1419723 RepID=A0ABV8ULL9_9PROT
MSTEHVSVTPELFNYIRQVSLRETDLRRELREETAGLPEAQMQILPEQGQFMALLLRLMGARKGLEVGTFTGYSALCFAEVLPENGHLVCCDVSAEYTGIAQRYWERSGLRHKMDLRLAPALETLDQLIANGEQETYDFCFLDADKENYTSYYEKALELLRPGGLLMADNVLWSGRVAAESSDQSKATQALKLFNNQLAGDRRIELSLLPFADGLTLVVKK